MKFEFWKDWNRKTKTEEIAIKSIRKAKKILFETIPKKEISAIYVKGSFVRREMNGKSDVDIVPIVIDNKHLSKIKKLQKERGEEYSPSELLPHSISEFKKNKRHLKEKGPKGSPDVFLRHIKNHRLIYGKPIDMSEFKLKKVEDRLGGYISAFENTFLPLYYQNKFGFQQIIKCVFWLVDLEETVKGKNPPHSWKKLAKSIKNKNHIVHDTLRYRLYPTKDEKLREKYISKLKKYLENLK